MKAWLTETCQIRPYLRQGSGGALYADPEVRACRMEPAPRQKVVYKNPSGTLVETVAEMLMFCQGEPIPLFSRVLWHGRDMRVVCCAEMFGMGRHHLEVTLE